MRVLAIDFGFKRIGVALGESEFDIATPRPSIAASGALKKDAAALHTLARAEEADAVVLGLPVEEDGQEGKMARICRMLAEHLVTEGETVHLVNEVYSSLEAENALAEAKVRITRRKQLRDGEAACVIVQRFFDGQTTT